MYIDPVWRRYWQWYFLLNAIILFDLIVSVHGQIDTTASSSSRLNVNPIRRRKPLTTSTRRPIATGGSSAPDCDHGGCYPATGDLLVGRSANLYASSTCGLRRPERFCFIGNLKNVSCDVCDVKAPNKSHTIDQIVARSPGDLNKHTQAWWQAENDRENVTIQLNLEAEFVFTHLIMKFRTFRPKGMIIEKSADFGKTWRIYAYFAASCGTQFPYIPTLASPDLPYCESRYSDDTPSTGGEVVFRVLSPNTIGNRDPYSPSIQELIKITNLRINFTKLHTLGDNYLDTRQETTPKYYYALYEMVVRGSCSCYGHAKRCIPTEDELKGNITTLGKVYGRCNCTHHTEGLNCERCADLYNDRPWRPARIGQPNPCRLCECHGHAKRCRFDAVRFAQTNYTSGGVCEDCEHNTIGSKCEFCKDLFYKDNSLPITDAHVCKPCNCDAYGTRNKGSCVQYDDPQLELHAGQCICKEYVEGQRCDKCKAGFYNLDYNNPQGCQACDCHPYGIIDKQCDTTTGMCQCKPNIIGQRCDQCQENYYGLNENSPEGCRPCSCHPGGSYSPQCDINSGQCPCREGMIGRQCDTPAQGTYCAGLQFFTYEAELARVEEKKAIIFTYDNPNEQRSWTGTSIVRIYEGGTIDFDIYHMAHSGLYSLIIRYMPAPKTWESARIVVISQNRTQPNITLCGNQTYEQDLTFKLPANKTFTELTQSLCLNENEHYKLQLQLTKYGHGDNPRDPVISIDSIVFVPVIEKIDEFSKQPLLINDYETQQCKQLALTVTQPVELPEVCQKIICGLSALTIGRTLPCDCDPTGSISTQCDPIGGQCACKPYVMGTKCHLCVPGTYHFSPDGCTKCNCHNMGALNNLCNVVNGACYCRPNISGRDCSTCSLGFWNFPSCQRCECNGHSDLCEPDTGKCIDCRDSTGGDHCEKCADGYYGDARLGSTQVCKPCMCPGGPGSTQQFGDSCVHDPYTQQVVCRCRPGYTGPRCSQCAIAYYGSPTEQGGQCQPCSCNNNINVDDPESCDRRTGLCLKCLYNTGGPNCETCRAGFYGDALGPDKCIACDCGIGGVQDQICNSRTGACICKEYVEDTKTGRRCSQCVDGYWGLGRGYCSDCKCNPDGSESSVCDKFTGQCRCKPNRGGLRCDQCPPGTYGDPNACQPCQCSNDGAISSECDSQTGQCTCKPGVTGQLCDRCARAKYGVVPYCSTCGACFTNWDTIINRVTDQVQLSINRLNSVEIRQLESITNGYLFEQVDSLLDQAQISLGLKYNSNELDPYRYKYQTIIDRINRLTSLLTDEFQPEFLNQTKRFRFEEDLSHITNVISDTYKLIDFYKKQFNGAKHADLQSAGISAQTIEQELIDIKNHLIQLKDLSFQQQTRVSKLNESIMANNEEHRLKTQQTQEQLKNFIQTYDDLNEKYVNKGNVSEIVCGSRGMQNNQCSICGGEGCSSTCANSSSQCSSSIHGQLNELIQTINSTENELLIKQNETNLIYQHQYTIEKDITEILNKILLEQQKFLTFNITLNQTSSNIDLIQQQITNLTDILHDRKPADIRELIDRILTKKISLTSDNLEESIRDIRTLVEQAQISSQTGNELEKIRDATHKLNRAKGIEDALSPYVRLYDAQENGIEILDNLVDKLDNETTELKRLASGTNRRIDELKTAVIQTSDLLDKSEQNLNATSERLLQIQAVEQTLNSSIRNSIEVIAIETERNMDDFLPKYLEDLTTDLTKLNAHFVNYTRDKQDLPAETRSTAVRVRTLDTNMKALQQQITEYSSRLNNALKSYETSRETMPTVQRFEQLRDTARNTRDLIKQRATHYIDCYRVER
ncbi:unnamed protein product [Adineta steineri]|uniref:Laminin subunit beta-1 n=1 Tax=Adineta steineri TaxID=433720 RepID=A0A813Q870_9BILA|nr:unnamed protein product [Adineta steineri]